MTGQAPGEATISASIDGVSGTARVSVSLAPVATVVGVAFRLFEVVAGAFLGGDEHEIGVALLHARAQAAAELESGLAWQHPVADDDGKVNIASAKQLPCFGTIGCLDAAESLATHEVHQQLAQSRLVVDHQAIDDGRIVD